MTSSLNIRAALSLGAQLLNVSPSALLDCEVLLAYVLKKNRSYLRAWPDKTLRANEQSSFTALLMRRQTGEPVAHITGTREFWSRPFQVSPDVLIPRPETELLIEITQQKFQPHQPLNILDLGTGSGAIAITLALEFKQSKVIAIDASSAALTIAKKNAKQLGANNVDFIYSDWFTNAPNNTFDLIISNPPYICNTDPHLSAGDVRFEPSSALISEQQGLRDIKHIISYAPNFMCDDSYLLFEHGYQQGNDVQSLLKSAQFKAIEQFNDLQDHTRATLGRKPSS
ncbi:MAG: protein-(glutamine-N5) methyltransferase, release factor-specific [Cycloclasticus sp.]|nr:MAG: protein-(glutamine-N5) methyltransferase, release factor-specific [Cycloclasticus sp.]